MAEKTPTQQLAEKLLYTPAYAADKIRRCQGKGRRRFCRGLPASSSITPPRPSARWPLQPASRLLKDAGYQLFDPKKAYAPGDKVYFIQLNKAVVASTIGHPSL